MMKLKFISKEIIDKGWSQDKKYCATAADGTKYLLRISPEEKSNNREEAFRMQQKVAALGIPMCRPVEFGKCDEGVYMVETWVNGKDAREVVPYLADSRQYDYGLKAGRILKKIHSISAPCTQPEGELCTLRERDPWEEFNRIVWCAQASPLFASGMVNGYFDNDVPMEFWKLLALYISSNTLSSVCWAIPFGEGEINTMLNQAKEVLQWYDNMKNPVPTWYKNYNL